MQKSKISLARIIVQALYGLAVLPTDADVRVLCLAKRHMTELEALARPARVILADRAKSAPAPAPSPEHRSPAGLDRTTATTWTDAQCDLLIELTRLDWSTVRDALEEMHARSTHDQARRVAIASVIGKLDVVACGIIGFI
ncbi:MAG TPA: hypothetical protein VGC15_20390 [Acetobacteraceae bacterium]